MASINTDMTEGGVPKPQTKRIWQVFFILLIITALEFLIALGFNWPHSLKAFIFIAMTIVKAFYIVAEFMHLKHEVKVLIWSIILPMMFVAWLLLALLLEGGNILIK